jgi:hypothetical protein
MTALGRRTRAARLDRVVAVTLVPRNNDWWFYRRKGSHSPEMLKVTPHPADGMTAAHDEIPSEQRSISCEHSEHCPRR